MANHLESIMSLLAKLKSIELVLRASPTRSLTSDRLRRMAINLVSSNRGVQHKQVIAESLVPIDPAELLRTRQSVLNKSSAPTR